MTNHSQPVFSAKVQVATANFQLYDSVSEATSSLGEEKILKLINAQVRTNAMNEERARATGTPSEQSFKDQATTSLTAEEFMSVQQDVAKYRALIETKASALKAAYEANRPKVVASTDEAEST